MDMDFLVVVQRLEGVVDNNVELAVGSDPTSVLNTETR
jgi:hypothetical protein